MLNAQNIWNNRVNKSLNHKNLRPFEILRTINNSAYEFDLPQFINGIFPMFYPWLFHLDKSDPLLEQIIPLPSLIGFDKKVGLGKYIAKEILDSRIDKRKKDPVNNKKRCLIYKIKFTGWDE